MPISSILNRVKPLVGTIKQTNPAAAKASATKGVTSVKDIAQLTMSYVKQETKLPLQGLGRLIAFGVAGATLLGTGGVLLTLALLRGLQSGFAYERVKQTGEKLVRDRGSFSGGFSWAPYMLTGVAALAAIVFVLIMFKRESAKTNG